MCRAQVSGELVQSVVSNKDTGRDVQHAVFSIEVLNGGAAAGRVTFAKDFLKVAVQKLNNSIFHSSIPCLLFGAARRQVAFARTRLPPPYRLLAVSLRDLPDELRPGHVDGAVDAPRLGTRIVLEDFHHQRGIVGEYHAGLQHAQKPHLPFGLAESTGGDDSFGSKPEVMAPQQQRPVHLNEGT
jgi:hypothetical protein